MAGSPPPSKAQTIHATCVAIEGCAILLTGPSGSGKSDLALRLIDRGARLVSDDYTQLSNAPDGMLFASAPATIAGKMEIRGIGIIEIPYIDAIPVRLVVELGAAPERLPLTALTARLGNTDLPMMKLSAFEASAPLKVETMLRQVRNSGAPLSERPDER